MADGDATTLETTTLPEDDSTKWYLSAESDGRSQYKWIYIYIVSFNLHRQVVQELINKVFPDIILLQEYWLTPGNVCKLDIDFPEYVAIGKSAREPCVEQGH